MELTDQQRELVERFEREVREWTNAVAVGADASGEEAVYNAAERAVRGWCGEQGLDRRLTEATVETIRIEAGDDALTVFFAPQVCSIDIAIDGGEDGRA